LVASFLGQKPRHASCNATALVRALALLASILLLPAICRADPVSTRANEPKVVPAPASLWRSSWPTFSWVEGVATVSAGVGTLVLALVEPPHDPRWHGGILFDDAVRKGLRLKSPSARQMAGDVGDLPYYSAGLIPLVVDPVLVAWIVRDDPKAAFNLAAVALESFSYAGLLSYVSTRVSVRDRPGSAECRQERAEGRRCRISTESFWSGHTSIAAASAGIVCASHGYLPLWKYPALDAAACAVTTAGALGVGLSRLLADRHYASDVIAGTAVGFGVGYGVPVLLHYSRRSTGLAVSIQAGAPCPNGCVRVSGSF
jgi:membrane-associated phospholipid phosphatase